MKPDADQFQKVLSDLPRKYGIDGSRKKWLRFAFHLTDVRNAAQILRDGKVRCRADLERKGGIPLDIASPKVIARTGANVKEVVRLYFRPLTPTQYRWEGIRPKGSLWEGSHCPVPVFFLFDLLSILTLDESRFSDGNLAKLGFDQLCTSADELASFDFRKIFHRDRLSDEEKQDIISHRNAEIVVPKELGLENLKYIFCRTPAEKETLIYLLPDDLKRVWAPRIYVESGSGLFFREYMFVETAILTENQTTLIFAPDSKVSGPFELSIDCQGHISFLHQKTDFFPSGKLQIGFRKPNQQYTIELRLDDHLAYASSYDGNDDFLL